MSKLQKPKPTTFGLVKFHLVDDSFELYQKKPVDEYIEQLEAENKQLKDHISQAEKMVDVHKLVKPLVWEKCDGEDMWYCRLENGKINLIDLVIIKEDGEYTFGYGGNVGYLPAHKTLKSCQQFVQDWLVSLVSNACGLESEVRNG